MNSDHSISTDAGSGQWIQYTSVLMQVKRLVYMKDDDIRNTIIIRRHKLVPLIVDTKGIFSDKSHCEGLLTQSGSFTENFETRCRLEVECQGIYTSLSVDKSQLSLPPNLKLHCGDKLDYMCH